MIYKTLVLIIKNQMWINKYILLIGTEDFGNLGDHQIAESEIEFIKKYFPQYLIIEVPASIFYKIEWRIVKRFIQEDTLIFMTGGGNWGNDYLFSHNIKRNVIKEFPKNLKVVFPVTINYTNTNEGQKILKEDVLLLDSEDRLILAVRDDKSYEIANHYFKNIKVNLMPDIVLFSNKKSYENREGCIICIRNDKESIMSIEDRNQIIGKAKELFEDIEFLDTQYEYNIRICERRKALDVVFNKFRKTKLVITDRLHGVIFSVITGTPLIAFENKNCKIEGVWKWVGGITNNHFVHNMQEFENAINDMDSLKFMNNHEKLCLESYYECLYKLIMEGWRYSDK